MTTRWPSRFVAFSLWALATLSAGYWLLKVTGSSETPVSAGTLGTQTPAIDVQDLARALGPAATPATSGGVAATPQTLAADPGPRMQLLGVVAGRRSAGVALISIEGQFPRPYRVGSPVDEHYRLSRVEIRSATLTPTRPDGRTITLELPESVGGVTPAPVRSAAGATNRLPRIAASVPGAPAAAAGANNVAVTPANDADEAAKD